MRKDCSLLLYHIALCYLNVNILYISTSYSYHTQLPCVPPTEKTYLLVGQDYYSIVNYTRSFDIVSPCAHGYMTYLTLHDLTLTKLTTPQSYGSGIEWLSVLSKQSCGRVHFSPIIQIGLYLVNQTKAVHNGLLDREIDILSIYLQSLNSSIYLRIGYEFDSIYNEYDYDDYILCYQYIVDRFRSNLVHNVAFVWHSWAQETYQGHRISAWYPGTDYVDWCGISLFTQPYHCLPPNHCNNNDYKDYVTSVISFCKERNLPMMIAESTPFGGIIVNEKDTNRAGYKGDTWKHWFVPVLRFIYHHNIKMWCYINCNWDSFPMWQLDRPVNEHWGDSRVQAHHATRLNWELNVLQKSRFNWYWNSNSRDETSPKDDCQIHDARQTRVSWIRILAMVNFGLICCAVIAYVSFRIFHCYLQHSYVKINEPRDGL